MSYFSQFSGNNNVTPTNLQVINSSTVWVAPGTGWVTFAAFGGGGRGGLANSVTQKRAAITSGGGAGGTSIKTAYVIAGSSYTITVGAGGVSTFSLNASSNFPTTIAGISGNLTQIVGPGVSITANGGAGGDATLTTGSATGSGTIFTASGGIGGTATGGDVNYTGGRGGNASMFYVNSGTWRACFSGGGGATNIWGKDTQGGDMSVSATLAVSTTIFGTGGGGGVGGPGYGAAVVSDTSLSTLLTAISGVVEGAGGGTGPDIFNGSAYKFRINSSTGFSFGTNTTGAPYAANFLGTRINNAFYRQRTFAIAISAPDGDPIGLVKTVPNFMGLKLYGYATTEPGMGTTIILDASYPYTELGCGNGAGNYDSTNGVFTSSFFRNLTLFGGSAGRSGKFDNGVSITAGNYGGFAGGGHGGNSISDTSYSAENPLQVIGGGNGAVFIATYFGY